MASDSKRRGLSTSAAEQAGRSPLTQLHGLRLLANGFNNFREVTPLPTPPAAPAEVAVYLLRESEAWAAVERALTSPEGPENGFNALAATRPMVLEVGPGGPQTRWENRFDQLLWLAWRYYFHEQGWDRLKRCVTCQRWLVDETRNKSTQFCSRRCHDRQWSRAKRRASGHRQ